MDVFLGTLCEILHLGRLSTGNILSIIQMTRSYFFFLKYRFRKNSLRDFNLFNVSVKNLKSVYKIRTGESIGKFSQGVKEEVLRLMERQVRKLLKLG